MLGQDCGELGGAMKEFLGKVAVITGAASGIGLGIAHALARRGMKIVLADIEKDALERAREDLERRQAEVIAIEVDVSDRAAVKRAADEAVAAFGKVHVLCNNAGVGRSVRLDEATAADWDWVLGVNLHGTINGLLAFLPLIKAHGEGGHVVNTSSLSGLRYSPDRGQGIYSTTKFALIGLSEALASDLRDTNIGVSVLCPAFVKTQMPHSGRNRPDRFGGPAVQKRAPDDPLLAGALTGKEPDLVGEYVATAIAENQLHILTDAKERHLVEARFKSIVDVFDYTGQRDAAEARGK
jgi:NAD(P)-dependent dehydrogenase (short-subunit alcohol dehydrogenase family)